MSHFAHTHASFFAAKSGPMITPEWFRFRTSLINSFVKGHDFSRAANAAKNHWALAPEDAFRAAEHL
jgi:hypothetical protein